MRGADEPPALTLLIPGLSGTGERASDAAPEPGEGRLADLPPLPALGSLLAAATAFPVPVSGPEATLLHLSGIPQERAQDAACAAFCRLGEGRAPVDGWWLCADPVHLRVDFDRLVLSDGEALAVTGAEAAALAAELNERLFHLDGLELEAPSPTRWYLRLTGDPQIRTCALSSVVGRDVAPCLPEGPGARVWRTRLNEVQMVLHMSPVNEARAARGLAPINGLWFWGPGTVAAPSPGWSRVFGGGVLAQGVAAATGRSHEPVPDSAAALLTAASADRPVLAVLDHARVPMLHGDTVRWREALAALERDWFVALRAHLREVRSFHPVLYTGDGRAWRLRAPPRWRRRATIHSALRNFFR
ncbi:cofactor-independent phosphoglycerate mutase [bacterium BMS3Bbin12]|nr:cofactor-independent phosphoglycerate mutase [bacterium BMS3Abin12]GBE47399.1 cofactor-independent phosphoglycerate mutase [bacterium BMS3Bbin12]GBE50856.1 cofactor-independent phosphoglycerate mutase [bacterium BMS3Bbin13]HDJ86858.1 hypothetical protein [Chromatiales bacterium]